MAGKSVSGLVAAGVFVGAFQSVIAFAESTPIKVRDHGRLLVSVAVNGNEAQTFLLDTGATTTVISEKIAGKIGITGKRAARVHTFARHNLARGWSNVAQRLHPVSFDSRGPGVVSSLLGRREVVKAQIPALKIGDKPFRNIRVLLARRQPGRYEDGFLPLRFFDSIYVNHLENFLIVNPQRW